MAGWMDAYEETTHEIVRADDAPTNYFICSTCFGLIAPWYMQAHYDYHKDRGDFGE